MKIHPARISLAALILFLAGAGWPASPSLAADAPTTAPVTAPHIVFVLADDLGTGDTSLAGEKIAPTPALEKLAREGTRFTNYYAASPICSPSRCGLITGQYPGRWHLTSYLQTRAGNRACGQADFLDPSAPSLPRLLKEHGYATAHIGKWHLGGGRDVVAAPRLARYGYDVGLGTWESPEPAAGLGVEFPPWAQRTEPHQVARHDRTRWMVDEALMFLRKNSQPCFINLWLDDPHTPWVPEGSVPAAPRDSRENLAGVITEMDRQLGRLFAGVPDNTLVIFTSDNGPLPVFKGARTNHLRGSKLSLYEGGIRVPFVARWPGRIPVGKVDQTSVFHAADMLPTLATLAGVPGSSLPSGDGKDVAAVLTGTPAVRSTPLFWEYGRNDTAFKFPPAPLRSPPLAVRDGAWKLLVHPDGSGAELYNLETDPAESKNAAAEQPEITARLRDSLLQWRRSLPELAPP